MKTLLIRGGHVVDPVQEIDRPADVLVAGDQVAGVGDPGSFGEAGETIDATGCIVTPGLIDMQVRLGEPGFEKAETIATGSRAAVVGGFSTIACLPDTEPPIDNEASAEYVFLQASRANGANVLPIGCLTKNRGGEFLAEMGQLAHAGAVAFSDADQPLANASLMGKALKYATMFDAPVIQLPLEPSLSTGVMHAGFHAARLGMGGIPAAAEEIMIARDLVLARDAGAHLHVGCVTTRGGVELIRRAKEQGIRVTCSVTPHHLLLTDELVTQFDANAHKVLPPLRTRHHIEALVEGLRDGTIDVVTSDHWPQPGEDKVREFDAAPFGVVGLETTLGLMLEHFVKPGIISMPRLIGLLCVAPAAILRLDAKRSLEKGSDADLTVFDPAAGWTVEPEQFSSKSRNTPFGGQVLPGRARHVVVMGTRHDLVRQPA